MKNSKILSLVVFAVTASLMVLAASASATTLTSPSGTTYTSTVKAESEGAITIDGAFTSVSCQKSTAEGKVESHGAGVTAKGTLSSLTFTECNFLVSVLKRGTAEVHAGGTLTSSGGEVSISTSVGTCVFTTSSTDVGTGTGTKTTGGNATIDFNSAKIPRTGGNFLCGSSGTLTGSYKITTPSTLFLD